MWIFEHFIPFLQHCLLFLAFRFLSCFFFCCLRLSCLFPVLLNLSKFCKTFQLLLNLTWQLIRLIIYQPSMRYGHAMPMMAGLPIGENVPVKVVNISIRACIL